MKIIGFNLVKIFSEKKEKKEGKLEIKQNVDIEDILKDKINFSDSDILKVNFSYTVDYSPDFAKIELKGNVLLIPEKEQAKKILKDWKSKKVEDEFRIPLFNFIMHKCNIKALNLEDEMALPLHLPMPRITQKSE